MSSVDKRLPQYKLEAFAAPLLLVGEGQKDLRTQFIEIASAESPTQTFKLAELLAKTKYHLNDEDARGMAQAARWLAVLKRDYGQEVFQKMIEGKA